MTRPIPPTAVEAHEAAARIAERRTRLRPEDKDRSRMPMDPDTYPYLADMVQFVLMYRRVPKDTRKADFLDALIIEAHLRSVRDLREMNLIDAARGDGASWTEVSRSLRVAKQAAQQRRLRASGATLGERKDEKRIRAAVRLQQAEAAAAVDQGEELTAICMEVVEALEFVELPSDEDVRDYLMDLRGAVFGPTVDPVRAAAAARLLLRSLVPYRTPEGCDALLARLAARLPTQKAP